MENMELYEKVRQVPDEAKKPIKGGRLKGMTDINPMWRIKTLTEHYGPCGIGWYYIPTKKWMEVHGDEVAGFVDIELYLKVGDEWSKPIHGSGGSKFATKESGGVHISDEVYKMATTDALSVACKQLGIGADVYWETDRTKYNGKENNNGNNITEDQLNQIYHELSRTGIGKKGTCQNYKVSDLSELTKEQAKSAIAVLLNRPDKPINPETVPPDNPEAGLPFN